VMMMMFVDDVVFMLLLFFVYICIYIAIAYACVLCVSYLIHHDNVCRFGQTS
jgi:hypothetical protein